MMKAMRAALFDLDGVIVDTAKYHYLAWKRLAAQLGFDFTEADNERLKGVSRMRSLEILLEVGRLTVTPAVQQSLAAQKNTWYVEYISAMDPPELRPGAMDDIRFVKAHGVKIALASASKNAALILDRLQIAPLFDAVVDGTTVSQAKPDPEVFLHAAAALGIEPEGCVVFEDAAAGIAAAKRAGMGCVGIGHPENLSQAEVVIADFQHLLLVSLIQSGLPPKSYPAGDFEEADRLSLDKGCALP